MSENRSAVVDLCDRQAIADTVLCRCGIEPLPGRLLLQMVKPLRRGVILLPDLVTHQCDVGIVLRSGSAEFREGEALVIRPYAGLWLNLSGQLDGRLLGVNDPLWHSVIGRWDGETLAPCGPWVTAKPAESLLGPDSNWLEPLGWGSEAPDWMPLVTRFRASQFLDVLTVSPGFGLDSTLLVCTKA